jgi:hypothetical protein
MYDLALAAHSAYTDARKMSDRLAGSGDAALKAAVDSIAPPPVRGTRPRFGGGAPAATATLQSIQSTLLAAAMSMQNADVAITARQIDAVEKARAQYKGVMTRWRSLSARK